MKIRNGFVSNSSSSSFVCEVCNHTETGFDVGYEDVGFVRCENGHIMCEGHLINPDLNEPVVDDEYGEQCISATNCPICNYLEISFKDIRCYFLNTTDITIDVVMDEIKKINKRRRKVYDNEYVEYVLKAKGITVDQLLLDLKNQYPVYADFKTTIRGY